MATRATRSKTTASVPAPVAGTTRTRTTTATKTTMPATKTAPATKRTRKPLSGRENTTDADAPSVSKSKTKMTGKPAKPVNTIQTLDREPITAYLRIRPHLGDEEPSSTPYLLPLSDTTVRMTDPQENQGSRSRFRPSTISPSSTYTFSHVFPPETSQSNFFTKTTLPLVHDLLQGQNGLLFTYGVTNSGKTYTVQGGTSSGSAGILPRTLDVIFNSIEGLQGDGKYRPVRLYGVEPSDTNDGDLPQLSTEPTLAEVFGQLESINELDSAIDPTAIKVDRNYEYTVWISYAEVYNEKIYDLLESAKDESALRPDKYAPPRKSLLLTRKALPLRPSPASDNGDTEVNGKYIAGLRQFRIHSATQAKSLVKLGQLHRRVFGTLANRESSRSHGMVIIKIIRGHRGEKNDPTSLQVSRLTLVDLAGSERTKHTHTTGERLKEAGNINKSLMVLGQCMEVMRSNQRKLAASLGQEIVETGDNIDTRDVRKALAVIPFRHSKLTETLMDYFTGEGRVVMIVNVNPYDTGYDENSHVMKFSAIAREIYVTNAPAPVHKLPSIGPGKLQGQKFKKLSPLTMSGPEINPNPSVRKVTISMNMGKKISETVLEVVEVDEPSDEADDNNYDEPDNPLIDALFDEVENLRMQLFETEMRCALIEAETREEVMREMEERMRRLEEKHSRRLMTELEQNELKTDAKIDMLHKAGLFGSPVKGNHLISSPPSDTEEDEVADVEMSLMNVDGTDSEDDTEMPSQLLDNVNNSSPLAKKSKAIPRSVQNYVKKEATITASDQEDATMDESEDQDIETGENRNNGLSDLAAEVIEDEDEDEDEAQDEEEYVDDESDDSEEWRPPKNRSLKSDKSTNTTTSHRTSTSRAKISKQPRIPKLEGEMKDLSIREDEDESVILLPAKSKRAKKVLYQSESDEETGRMEQSGEEEEAFAPATKKKKRQLSKKPVVTAENIERVTWEVEKKVAKTQGNRNIRRFTSGNR